MESQSATVLLDTALHELPVDLSKPCLTEDADPLVFWKENQSSFPNLAALACKYLAIPASSAPVERIFSIAGKSFPPERCCLNDKTFEELMTQLDATMLPYKLRTVINDHCIYHNFVSFVHFQIKIWQIIQNGGNLCFIACKVFLVLTPKLLLNVTNSSCYLAIRNFSELQWIQFHLL